LKPAGEKRSGPVPDLDIDIGLEYTRPGSPQDDQLRREQAKAVLDLVSSHRRRAAVSKGDEGDDCQRS
jgi:hypothetical protein